MHRIHPPTPLWIRVLWVLLTMALLASCSEDSEPSGATASIAEDTGVATMDTTQAADTATEADTATPPDTAVDPDTAAPEDTNPQDTTPEPDTVEPTDTAEPEPDTAEPMDTSVVDTEPEPDTAPDVEEDTGEPTIAERCFAGLNAQGPAPDYDQFEPIIGSHCSGTNHQEITGVERVVIFGDSVTQGTPNDVLPLCVQNDHFYRNQLSEWLALFFDLDRGSLLDWASWKSYSCLYNGEPGLMESGDFMNCSKWGARTDDLLGDTNCNRYDGAERERCCEVCCADGTCGGGGSCVRAANPVAEDALCGDGRQISQCLPQGPINERTLFVFTMGGNDVAKITQEGAAFDSSTAEGRAEIEAGYPSIWAIAERTIAYLEQAVAFLKDPERFPNGSYGAFANSFEFTDGTGQTSACSPDSINIPGFGPIDISDLGLDLAGLAGFGEWERPEVQRDIVLWVTEQFMRIAVDYQADMILMLENFCGHGYVAAGPDPDTENSCYREDDPTLWFDITCIHPNEAGHTAIYSMFKDVVEE